MNWMPAPQAPMGCPPGLEYLAAIDQVLVQQQIELLEGMLFMYSSYLNNLQKFVVYALYMLNFSLFQTLYHTHYYAQKQRKIKFKPRKTT